MTVVYFGPRWDSPLLVGALEAGTPIGRPCTGCGEVIIRGDRGLIEIADTASGNPEAGTVAHIHAECRLDQLAGHLIGMCACLAIPPGRDRALEIWKHFYNNNGESLWMTTPS